MALKPAESLSANNVNYTMSTMTMHDSIIVVFITCTEIATIIAFSDIDRPFEVENKKQHQKANQDVNIILVLHQFELLFF
jgi:hypothetical protein